MVTILFNFFKTEYFFSLNIVSHYLQNITLMTMEGNLYITENSISENWIVNLFATIKL